MYSFEKLLLLYNITSNSDDFKKHYIDNLSVNLTKNIDNLDETNYLLNFIIINSIHYKIEKYIKKIYIICPLIFTYTFIYGFKQLIYMIK